MSKIDNQCGFIDEWLKEILLRNAKDKRATTYAVAIYTPDRGAGGTDKHPLLIWYNDIGIEYHKVKYSGGGSCFERNTLGLGEIESVYPLQFGRLAVSLSNDGGDNLPSWRIGGVEIAWREGDDFKGACFWFDQDLSPGGPSIHTLANSGCSSVPNARRFMLREVAMNLEDQQSVHQNLRDNLAKE